MEKFWTWAEKIPLYRVLHEHRWFGRIVNREVLSYLFFGVLTTLVGLLMFWLPTELFGAIGYQGVVHYVLRSAKDFSYMEANVISWICAVAFAYVTNKLLVFSSKSWDAKTVWPELAAFVGGRVATLLVELGLLFVFVTLLGMRKLIAKLIVGVVVVILNYVISKLFVFREKQKEDAE